MQNEQELADNLMSLKTKYNSIAEMTTNDKIECDNMLTSCQIAHDACLTNSIEKMEQAVFFLDKVI